MPKSCARLPCCLGAQVPARLLHLHQLQQHAPPAAHARPARQGGERMTGLELTCVALPLFVGRLDIRSDCAHAHSRSTWARGCVLALRRIAPADWSKHADCHEFAGDVLSLSNATASIWPIGRNTRDVTLLMTGC